MKPRLYNAAAVALLFVVFAITYKLFVVPVYAYYGMGWRDPPAYMLASSLLMNVTIAFLANPVYRRPSQFFLMIQFLVVFLPASIVCLNVTLPEVREDLAFRMVVFMFIGILFQTLFSQKKGGHSVLRRRIQISKPKMIVAFLCFAVIILACVLFWLGRLFALTSFASMYDQRELLDDQSVGIFLRYGISWVIFIVLPTLLVTGLSLRGWRRAALICFGIVAFFILFGITATKTTLLAPVIIALIYVGLSRTRFSYVLNFALGFAALLAVPIAISAFESLDLVSMVYVGLVNFRIFSVPQTLYVQYLDFFSTHPNTWGSHISVVSWFVTYPFDSPVYALIGDYYYPGSNQTANSGAWAQDGIAGFGLFGIPLMSVLLTGIMRVLDYAADGLDSRKLGAAFAMSGLQLSNVSFFTVLLTGGLAIAIVLLYVVARNLNGVAPPVRGSVVG